MFVRNWKIISFIIYDLPCELPINVSNSFGIKLISIIVCLDVIKVNISFIIWSLYACDCNILQSNSNAIFGIVCFKILSSNEIEFIIWIN